MRIKHNKKRNTAFVYEALIVETTIAILKKDESRRAQAVNILRKHFTGGNVLKKDLDCYRSLYETQNLNIDNSKRIIEEAKSQQRFLDFNGLFKAQTGLINDINKNLGSSVFNNFVPNYKTLATIAQIFSDKTSPKNQIILENQLLTEMCGAKTEITFDKMDNLVLEAFAKKFNSKYDSLLLNEQKELLMHYISSFSDNAVSLKVFLNEEIKRLKDRLEHAKIVEEVKTDGEMLDKTEQVIEKLNTVAAEPFSSDSLLTIMKIQSLIKEIYTNGDSS